MAPGYLHSPGGSPGREGSYAGPGFDQPQLTSPTLLCEVAKIYPSTKAHSETSPRPFGAAVR
jgi:hypothetical protein